MAMEPPAKRLRLTEADSDNQDEGDELNFQPQEISERRDPDYQLARRRVKAGNRFQQAMAGIFTKYARDFTNVGDEIDLETGEVVVDNGHLANMRHEGDVGVDEDEQDDEEGGILLGDFVDDDDEGVRLEDLPDDWNGARGVEDKEEDGTMRGQVAPSNSMTLGPAWNQRPENHTLLPFLPANGGSMEFDHVTNPFFGDSPLNIPQWSFLNGLDSASWDAPSFSPPPGHKAKARPRYQKQTSSAYNGRASIWAPEPGFQDEWVMRPRTRVGTMGRLRKSISSSRLLPAATEGRSNSDNEYEEAIPEGRRSEDGPAQRQPRDNTTDGEDDPLGVYGAARGPPSLSDGNGKVSPGDNRMAIVRRMGSMADKKLSDHRAIRHSPGANRTIASPRPKLPPKPEPRVTKQVVAAKMRKGMEPVTGDTTRPDRRRSGRARKQVDYLGKISWAEALEQARSNKLVVELRGAGPFEREDYEMVDDVHDHQGLLTPPESGLDSSDKESQGAPESSKGETIPDSQETLTRERSSPARDDNDIARTAFAYVPGDSSYALSDDESPVMFTKPKSSISKKKTSIGGGCQPSSPKVATPSMADGKVNEPYKPQVSAQASTSAVAARREVPDSQDDTVDLDMAVAREEPTKPRPRKRGRPRKTEKFTNRNPIAVEPSQYESTARSVVDDGRPEAAPPDTADLGKTGEHHGAQLDVEARDSQEVTVGSLDGPVHPESSRSKRFSRTIADSEDEHSTLPASSGAERTARELRNREKQQHDSHTTSSILLNRNKTSPPKHTPAKQSLPKEFSSKLTPSEPQTPRRTTIPTSKAPSSRRSILSLVSDDDGGNDELLRSDGDVVTMRNLFSSTRKPWKSSSRTTEVYHTPVKKRKKDAMSPGNVVKTPGGTTRTCGVDGYRCGRDFCFTCL